MSFGSLHGMSLTAEVRAQIARLSGRPGAEVPENRAMPAAISRDVKKAITELGSIISLRERARLLRELAVDFGYKGPCPMADEMDAAEPPGPAEAK